MFEKTLRPVSIVHLEISIQHDRRILQEEQNFIWQDLILLLFYCVAKQCRDLMNITS